jgi:hypothetical protein
VICIVQAEVLVDRDLFFGSRNLANVFCDLMMDQVPGGELDSYVVCTTVAVFSGRLTVSYQAVWPDPVDVLDGAGRLLLHDVT